MVLTERSDNHVHSVITSVLHTAHSEHQAIYVACVACACMHTSKVAQSREVCYTVHMYTLKLVVVDDTSTVSSVYM